MKNKLLAALILIFIGITLAAPSQASEPLLSSQPTAYQFSFKDIDGNDMPLSNYKGKVLLVVNTASHCGLTPQYKDLETLSKTYKDKGLVVLGVPSADFGGQEFGTEAEVKSFTEENFAISFPLTNISKVSGQQAHPFYVWAGEQAGAWGYPQWNFHKYLIAKDGRFLAWFGSRTSPTSASVTKAIEKALKEEQP